jgi:hypothetical protein
MFVPELGQPDGRVHRNLHLHDLMFRNPFDQRFEVEIESRMQRFALWKVLYWLFSDGGKPRTVGGLLFSAV